MVRVALLAAVLAMVSIAESANGQPVEHVEISGEVSSVTIRGLERVSRHEVVGQLKTMVGEPLDRELVRGDVRRISDLGQFRFVDAAARLDADGSVEVIFDLVEAPLVGAVRIIGHSLVAEEDLMELVNTPVGSIADRYQVGRSRRDMEQLYRQRGHEFASVTFDQFEFDRQVILTFRIDERSTDAALRKQLDETQTSNELLAERIRTLTETIRDLAATVEDFKRRLEGVEGEGRDAPTRPQSSCHPFAPILDAEPGRPTMLLNDAYSWDVMLGLEIP